MVEGEGSMVKERGREGLYGGEGGLYRRGEGLYCAGVPTNICIIILFVFIAYTCFTK